LDILTYEPDKIYELEEQDTPVITSSTPNTMGDFETDLVDNSIFLKNVNNGKQYYFKIGMKDNKKMLFSSKTNDQGTFKNLDFRSEFKRILRDLELNLQANKGVLDALFGTDLNREIVYDFLKNGSLAPIDVSKINKKTEIGKIIYGFGLKNIPNVVDFGNLKLLLKKLYLKNELSIKDKNMHNIMGFKNIGNLSDNFVKIIMDITSNKKPSIYTINQLKTDEKNLYNRLLIISGIHKDIKVNQKEKLDQINKLKNDLGVAEGEIQAGNDNPLILSELQQIIYKLQQLNAISLYQAQNYLKQFKFKK